MKTTYKVLATTGYDGHAEGEEFEAELDEATERRALDRGSIEIVKSMRTKKEEKSG